MISTQASLYEYSQMFGVSEQLATQAAAKGVVMTYTSSSTLVVKLGDLILAVIPIKGAVISLAKAGSLGPASMLSIRGQIEAALNKAIEFKPTPEDSSVYEDPESQEEDGKGDDVDPPKTFSIDLESVAAKKGEASDLPSAVTVKLSEAVALGQPVHGTSAGSVYKVVALIDQGGLNIAARYQNGKLSVRAEGGTLSYYAPSLKSCGFTEGKSYMSCHYNVPDLLMCAKTIGAIVAVVVKGNTQQIANVMETLK